jgi:O-antigen/teichoic acid export membrane protein
VLAWVSTLGVPAAATRFVPQAIAQGRLGLAAGFFRTSALVVATSSVCVALVGSALVAIFAWNASGNEFQTMILGMLLVPFLAALIAQNDAGRSIYLLTPALLPNILLRQAVLLVGVTGLHLLGVELNAAWTMGVLLVSVAALATGQFVFIRRAVNKVTGAATPEYRSREWIMAGLPLVVAFGFSGFFLEINVALAGAFLSHADLAVFNLAFQITNLIGSFLIAIGYQFGPHASRLYGQGKLDELQTMISRTSQIRFIFAVAMFIGVAVSGELILGLFKFESGYVALMILACSQLVAGIVGPVSVLRNVFGLQRWAIAVSAISVALDLALMALLATEFGIEGAALSVLATVTVWNVLTLVTVIRNTAIEPSVFGLRNFFGRPHRSGLEPAPLDDDLGSGLGSN